MDELLRTKEDTPGDRLRWKGVARRYQRFLARSKWSADAWVRYGYALNKSGDPDPAAHAYAMALSLGASGMSDAHLLAGLLHEEQGNRQKALQSYKSALRFNPENSDALEELRAIGIVDDELVSIIDEGREDRLKLGLHPSDRITANKLDFPDGRNVWSPVLAAVIALVLLCGGAWMLFDSPKFGRDAYRIALREVQWLQSRQNAEIKAPEQKAADERISVETAARKAAEEKAAVETAARKAVEGKAVVEIVARKVAEEKAAVETAARKVAEEKAAVETAARKVAEEKAAAEATARKAAEEKGEAEATARKAVEGKIAAEAAARKVAEDIRLTGEEGARKAAALPDPAAQAKRADEMKLDPRQQAERAEAGLNLSEQDRKGVQVALNSLGYEFPTATGYFGPRTRAMVAAWQKAQGLPETGFLTASQLATLQQQAASALAKYDQGRTDPKTTPRP